MRAALRRSPRDRIGAVFNVIGGALLVSRRFDESIRKARLNLPPPN
jgi:hypothetical protein